jgi:hypothetical protein
VLAAGVDGGTGEVAETVAVVVVQVGQDDGLEVGTWVDAPSGQPGADAFLGGDVDVDGEVEERLPAGEVARVRRAG